MQEPQPIIIVDLFPRILDALLDLLSGLSPEEWEKATVCDHWSVTDVALHLLGGDMGILSRQRDGHRPVVSLDGEGWQELVSWLNSWNEQWVQAARRTSPRLIIDLMRSMGIQVCEYFQSLDPYAMGDPVSWAGPDPAPVWLDLAREYTERWHHQQHIRDAVGKTGLRQPEFLAPVLDTFARALPHTYREIDAPHGTVVTLTITGKSGGTWSLLREEKSWSLYLDVSRTPDATVFVDEDVAWRMFTKGLSKAEARDQIAVVGDPSLGLPILDAVSIIA